MIYQQQLTTGGATDIFYSTDDGTLGGENQDFAITCIALCNTGAPDPTNENTNSATVNVYINGSAAANKIVSSLTIPAGETVFLSEERIVLSQNSLGVPDSVWVQATANLITVTLSVLRV